MHGRTHREEVLCNLSQCLFLLVAARRLRLVVSRADDGSRTQRTGRVWLHAQREGVAALQQCNERRQSHPDGHCEGQQAASGTVRPDSGCLLSLAMAVGMRLAALVVHVANYRIWANYSIWAVGMRLAALVVHGPITVKVRAAAGTNYSMYRARFYMYHRASLAPSKTNGVARSLTHERHRASKPAAAAV